MEKVRVALVGVGGISQIVRIPALLKMEDVELVALCDIDEGRLAVVSEKFGINKVHFDMQNLLKSEKLDGIFICTPNNFHYPMALLALEYGIPVLVEKPIALNYEQASRLADISGQSGVHLVIGMNNRFRDDAIILKDFLEKNELGAPFYIKSGWLRRWGRQPHQYWMNDPRISGGGVMMDMGIQLIDLALWLTGKPDVKSIRSFMYNIFDEGDVEDSALAVIETYDQAVITVEVSWRMHLEKDMNYTHVFGKQGGAFMNPLRLFKEMHGNLVNVTPVYTESNVDVFKNSFELEIRNFIEVIKGKAEPVTPAQDGAYIMRIMDKVYESARTGRQIDLEK
jgi:predicted dehydrogenase